MTRASTSSGTQDSPPLLEAADLVKHYPTGTDVLEVLRGVSLRVAPGEIVAVVGESGSGKSTLLHLLGGLDRPTSGRVHFRGEDLSGKDDEALAAFRNREVGFVFQFHHLLPEFTALENVAMPALIRQQRWADVRGRAAELLRVVGLSARAEHRPGELSGGEKQRVAVARALMNEPALVLADEPTGNLDHRTAEALHAEIRRLNEALGQTFVLVTHNPALADVAHRTLHLEGGVLVPEASAPEASASEVPLPGDPGDAAS